MLESLTPISPDPLLKLIGEFASDKLTHKIDLGVGVYRNGAGSGHINLAGLNEKTVAEFGAALKLVLAEP